MNSPLFLYTYFPSGVGVKIRMDPSTWYGVGKGGWKEQRGRTRFLSKGEFGCGGRLLAHTQSFPYAPLTPQYSSTTTSSSPSTSEHPLNPRFLALATRSASQRLLCINKYCSYSPYPPNHLLDSSPPPPRHHPNSPYLGRHCRHQRLPDSVVYSTVPFPSHTYTVHPVHHPRTWMEPASGLLCPLLYCT
jgi:hypothetical protein